MYEKNATGKMLRGRLANFKMEIQVKNMHARITTFLIVF